MIKNIYPNFDEFRKLSKKGNLIPVYKEILADLETPVSTFLKLAGEERHSYLLESVEGGERWGRYSFIAWEPKYIFQSKGMRYSLNKPGEKTVWKESPNPLANLKELMNSFIPVEVKGLPRFWGGAVGYVSYDMVRFFERLTQKPKDTLKVPDCIFLITDKMVVFDHLSHTLKIAVCVDIEGKKNLASAYREAEKEIEKIEDKLQKPLKAEKLKKFKSEPIRSNIDKSDFLKKVEKAKHYIRIGDIIQVVPSQRFSRKTKADPFRHIPRAPADKPVAVHVLPAERRFRHHRLISRDTRP